MDRVNVERIREFARRNPKSASPLGRWEAIVIESLWRSFSDVRATFNSADYVKGKVIFNIGGNNWRLVAVVVYSGHRVIVRKVMTHEEYNRERW